MALILKGLPESYEPFAVHVAQSEVEMLFADFKTKLRRDEDAEKMHGSSNI